MKDTCPFCDSPLEWRSGQYFCENCNLYLEKKAFCNTCGDQVEKLQACGATNYFCHTCNELKSRSSVSTVFEKVTNEAQ